MHSRILATAFAALLLATFAEAGVWTDCSVTPSTASEIGAGPRVFELASGGTFTGGPTRKACYDFDTNESTATSGLLVIEKCLSAKMTFWPDLNAGSQFTAELDFLACPSKAITGACRKICTDLDGGGVDCVTLNGDDGSDPDSDTNLEQRWAIYGYQGTYIYADPDTLPTGAVISRAMVHCLPNGE